MKNYLGKTYNVVTYGSQMNVHESEKIRGILSCLVFVKNLILTVFYVNFS